MEDLSIFRILVLTAATLFVLGWAVVLLDAFTGFRLIEKIPKRWTGGFSKAFNWSFASVGVCLLALAIVRISGV